MNTIYEVVFQAMNEELVDLLCGEEIKKSQRNWNPKRDGVPVKKLHHRNGKSYYATKYISVKDAERMIKEEFRKELKKVKAVDPENAILTHNVTKANKTIQKIIKEHRKLSVNTSINDFIIKNYKYNKKVNAVRVVEKFVPGSTYKEKDKKRDERSVFNIIKANEISKEQYLKNESIFNEMFETGI